MLHLTGGMFLTCTPSLNPLQPTDIKPKNILQNYNNSRGSEPPTASWQPSNTNTFLCLPVSRVFPTSSSYKHHQPQASEQQAAPTLRPFLFRSPRTPSMRPLPSPRSSSSTNRSPSHINGSGAMAGDSTTHAATLQAHCPTAAAMAEALAFHAASQEPQAQREHNGRDSSYRCKFCNRRFCTPQSLGGHHNSHRRLKITWQETRGRSVRRGGSVRRGEASHPLQAAAPAVSPAPSEPSNQEGTVTSPPAPSEPSDQEGTVTIPPIRVVTVTLPGESALDILLRELQQPGGEGTRHDPNHRGRNAVLPEDLMSEDAMKWVDGLLIDPEEEEEAPAPALAWNNGGGGFADGSSVRMDPNLNL